MHGGLNAVALRAPLQSAVDAALDLRLDRGRDRPVALGLSGGGDSLALLHLAADWCVRARRPLLALTVDHGLHPDSAAWTAQAGRMAAEVGAAWRALVWTGPKPATGLPAAARAARHALLAEAAREAGACVLLLAHTADDVAEGEAMRRAEALTLGRLREWAPSPAWPEGHGVFLLRPLLRAGRSELRAWLRASALAWLDDPANTDPRSARARARVACPPRRPFDADLPKGFGEVTGDGRIRLPRTALATHPHARRTLQAAVACAAGAPASPRGRVIDRLLDRLTGTDPFTATAGGARIVADGRSVELGREIGRASIPVVLLKPGRPTSWDGRFEVAAPEAGWRVGTFAQHARLLHRAERAPFRSTPAWNRGAIPLFLREGEARPTGKGRTARLLVSLRFSGATGWIADERTAHQASINHNRS